MIIETSSTAPTSELLTDRCALGHVHSPDIAHRSLEKSCRVLLQTSCKSKEHRGDPLDYVPKKDID